ncbi:hypothetical protein BMMON2_33250 [Burkholderia mallei]
MIDAQRMRIARRAQLLHHLGKARGRRARQPERAHPVTQQVRPALVVERDERIARQHAHVRARDRAQIDRGEIVEQTLGRRRMLRGAGERIAKAGKVRRKRGKHVDAQRIARIARIRVRFVVDPAQRMLLRVALELRAQQMQERTHAHDVGKRRPVLRRHRRQPAMPAPRSSCSSTVSA